MHVPIMMAEVLDCLRPRPGDVAVDCTLGGGGHASAILECLQPGGRLLGLDIDPIELPRAEAYVRAAGGAAFFTARHDNFADLPRALAAEGLERVDIVLADLGVSAMQADNPRRGFAYKGVGPLDMRMNPLRGEPASALLARLGESELAELLHENADEPHAAIIAGLLKHQPIATTHAAERLARVGLARALPCLSKADIKASVRRTFQTLRIAVNDELSALDALLRSLPSCLAPGGRAAVLTFHPGEDRRVTSAFQAGRRAGVYDDVPCDVARPSRVEARANRRSTSARLRWAVRSQA